MQQIRYSFTLIEIVIAMLILSVVATAIGWHVQGLIAHHRFKSEAVALCSALQEAQFLSVIHQTECELVIFLKDHQLNYQLHSDEPLAVLDKSVKRLKAIQRITINHIKVDKGVFHIFSSGRIEPTVLLGLHRKIISEDKPEGLWLDLQTPLQIKLKQTS